MNKADSERIAADLEKKGYKPASNEKEADLILVNMCSVRQSAVDRIYSLAFKLKKLKDKKPKLKTILTGCITKADKKKFLEKFDLIVEKEKYLNCPPKYENMSLAYIPVSNGCNNSCTYCVVPFTRGRLVCRSHKEILKEVKKSAKNKIKEIWLLGQNVNDYASPDDSSINFAKLLKQVSDVPGDFKIKFTSPHPKNFSDELIETMASSGKIAHYLNLPLQSGDNKILKAMNRPYTAEQYKNLVEKIRKKMPDIVLSTDVIVGFPGETKSQFGNTLKLFKKLDFDMAYISKFSPRPGTIAFKMEDNISPKEKKRRWNVLNRIILKKLKEKKEIKKRKLIVVLGPTASGKSALAVRLAGKFGGEVISADSRQVYRGMDIGTGKITPDTKNYSNFSTGQAKKKHIFTHKGIPHYCIDVASPKKRFTVVQYRKLATEAINRIFRKKKIPIICGGTGFYIQALIDGIIIPPVKPDWRLRSNFNRFETEELFEKLKKLDPRRAKTIDKNNRRRLIRAIEIVKKTGKPVPPLQKHPLPLLRQGFGGQAYPVLMIGIKKSPEELKRLIHKRLLKRLKGGMISEIKRLHFEGAKSRTEPKGSGARIKKLHRNGVSWKRLEEFGLEYRYMALYLQGKLKYPEMIETLQKESEHYAKKQMTWFKRDKRIHWVKNQKEAEKLVKDFLGK